MYSIWCRASAGSGKKKDTLYLIPNHVSVWAYLSNIRYSSIFWCINNGLTMCKSSDFIYKLLEPQLCSCYCTPLHAFTTIFCNFVIALYIQGKDTFVDTALPQCMILAVSTSTFPTSLYVCIFFQIRIRNPLHLEGHPTGSYLLTFTPFETKERNFCFFV